MNAPEAGVRATPLLLFYGPHRVPAERATASGASRREGSERKLADASGRIPEARD